MPELLRLQTPLFELSIWCNDISQRQQAYCNTLHKRQPASELANAETAVIRFAPPWELVVASELGHKLPVAQPQLSQLALSQPLFFEQVSYQFEWLFLAEVEAAWLNHRSHTVNNSFRFVKATTAGLYPSAARLTGTINTGNDLGWLRLPISVKSAGQTQHYQIALEVLATKMDLSRDLPAMYQRIDQQFPLWRFSLAEKTEQDAATGNDRGQFPLLWLANFGHLRERFEQGLKVISQAPHSRLQANCSYNKADRLKGKLPHRLESQLQQDLANGRYNQRYRVEQPRLSVDTPENRFIKMAVSYCQQQLAQFEAKLRHSNQAPDQQRLSEAFFSELHRWQQPLHTMLNQRFLTDVRAFNGLNHESLVLQQKTGYSAVYRVWQELKFYLNVFANQACVSMKSVAEIYEVWCFLELRNTLINELGFEDVTPKQRTLVLNDFFEYQLKDGFAGAFEFQRADGVRAKLAHEPRFTRQGQQIRSYLVNQQPDMVLEVELAAPNSKRFIWIFDAKYRIKTDNHSGDSQLPDYVPDDAINQMHRYRDALIRITQEKPSSSQRKSRPVFGAFALYPGYFDQTTSSNPYAEAIREIGIGAFALLPSSPDAAGHYWLSQFLCEQLGNATNPHPYNAQTHEEQWHIQEAARIAYGGMKQILYPDLTLTVALPGQNQRDPAYFAAFDQGTARWYHLPQSTFLTKYQQHIADEIRFLALATTSAEEPNTKQINQLWPVNSVRLVPRQQITAEQAGRARSSGELCYLFELGKPLMLKDRLTSVPHRPIKNSMKLTTLTKLEGAQKFAELESVYHEAWL